MNPIEYTEFVKETAIFPKEYDLVYPVLALNGEAGEVAEKVKKLIRDKGNRYSNEFRENVAKELGDVLWYTTATANSLGYNLQDIIELNVAKLRDRRARGVQGGSGDNR